MAPPQSGKSVDNGAFPTKQITVLAFCRLAEPIAFMSILAYSYVMVIELQDGDETNASFYAGLLVSAFAVAEAMTAMIWGTLSDRYGRKPVVLMGLTGTAISSLVFGFAKSYWVAFAARVIGGLLNGNVAVIQTMVAEMVKNPEHEPRAYAVQPFIWSLGSIIGPAMGGFLAQPAVYYPSTFSKNGLFGKFPYLLPNLAAVAAIVAAIFLGYLLLEETNPRFQDQGEETDDEEAILPDERTPLQASARRPSTISRRISQTNRRTSAGARRISATEIWDSGPGRVSLVAGGTPTVMDPSFDLRRQSVGTIHEITIVSRDRMPNGDHDSEGLKTFNRDVIMMIIALIIMCYHQMGFASILPIYLLDEPHYSKGFDVRGGLGYTVHDVGTYMAVNGVIALVIQVTIFPFVVERVGVWKSLAATTVFYPTSYIVMPLVSLLPRMAQPAGIYATLALQNLFAITFYPCALILLKNATPSPLVLGKVNGLAMSASSAARTVSPPLVGIIYSALGSAAAWWSCAIVASVAIVQLYWLPRGNINNVVVENALRKKSVAERPVSPVTEEA